jgi:hypothetical protein
MASAGWETAAGAGSTKITAVVSEEALSWEQDIAQAVIPFPAW